MMEIGEERRVREHEPRRTHGIVADLHAPAADVEVIGDRDELDPVTAVSEYAAERGVRRGRAIVVDAGRTAIEPRAGRDAVVLVHDQLLPRSGERENEQTCEGECDWLRAQSAAVQICDPMILQPPPWTRITPVTPQFCEGLEKGLDECGRLGAVSWVVDL